MANHLPSKTQKFLDSARGLAVLGRQRLDDVRHVLQVAQRLELRDEPRVGHERQVTRHAALDLGVDLGHHVTGVGLDQTVLDLRPGGVGELLDRAVERRVRRRRVQLLRQHPHRGALQRRRGVEQLLRNLRPAPWGSTRELSPHAARPAAPSTPTPIPRKPRRDHNGLSSMAIRLLRLASPEPAGRGQGASPSPVDFRAGRVRGRLPGRMASARFCRAVIGKVAPPPGGPSPACPEMLVPRAAERLPGRRCAHSTHFGKSRLGLNETREIAPPIHYHQYG